MSKKLLYLWGQFLLLLLRHCVPATWLQWLPASSSTSVADVEGG